VGERVLFFEPVLRPASGACLSLYRGLGGEESPAVIVEMVQAGERFGYKSGEDAWKLTDETRERRRSARGKSETRRRLSLTHSKARRKGDQGRKK